MTPQYSQDVQHRILRKPSSVLELIVQLEIDRAGVRGDETVTSDHEICREWPERSSNAPSQPSLYRWLLVNLKLHSPRLTR